MGSMVAAGFAEMVEEGLTTLEEAIHYHLSGNHFPPIPSIMVPVCLEAIEYANKGKYRHMIKLPNGVKFRGKSIVSVEDAISSLHLEQFLGL